MNSSTATPFPSPVTAHAQGADPHLAPVGPQRWSIVVHLGRGRGTTALMKVMSTLHVRHTQVSHMQFMTAPDGSGVLTIECSTTVASIETVRKSIEKAVQVVSATVHETPSAHSHRTSQRKPRRRAAR